VYYFESEVAPAGILLVREFLGKGVFEESEGAVVFKAENYNPKLHTRVFINQAGLPTYETKELGLTARKFEEYNPDLSIVTTAIEQKDYMSVVTEAIRQMFQEEKYADRMMHITHGMMRFASGKMSSRKGNVVTGESLLRDVKEVILEKVKDRDMSDDEKRSVAEIVGVAALKYSILKQATGSDIVYDFEKSISFEGDSGPYLQYAYIRAQSVIEKAKTAGITASSDAKEGQEIIILEKLLYRFPGVIEESGIFYAPHHIATYLIEIAGAFNNFYAHYQIIGESVSESSYRLALVEAFSTTMKNGLTLLGISTPEKM
jgi:arginyl-tRNA synthetase